jgi:nitrile hydratase beta subunit
MDGIHDLGGKLGFGPIDVTHDDAPFHAPWEGRMMAIARAISRPGGWNVDKFRHSRELEDPVAYLTRPYYDQWYKAYACMLVGSGLVTVEELGAGRSDGSRPEGLPAPMSAGDVTSPTAGNIRFDRPYDKKPRFAVGAPVVARNISTVGHARLPAYARARPGEIAAYHGAHILADASAHDRMEVEPLYSVRFALADLFPERAGSKDAVYLDLWESHLEKGA